MTTAYVETTAPPRCLCGHTIGAHVEDGPGDAVEVGRCQLMCCGCKCYRANLPRPVDDLDDLALVDAERPWPLGAGPEVEAEG